jgi:hypothetical protein
VNELNDEINSLYEDLSNFLKDLNDFYFEISTTLAPPNFDPSQPYTAYRHLDNQKTDSLACYLKGLKTISTLNACLVLMRSGHTQEVGALCRMIDDYCSEIFFLLVPGCGNSLDEHQEKFLNNFYQEEFLDHDDPLYSHQKRDMVPISKIHAAFAKYATDGLNPSDLQTISTVIHKTFSGYVHGAYPQIMEMYGGNPPHFHTFGMLNTPRVLDLIGHIVGYVDKLMLLTIFISKKCNSISTNQPLTLLKRHFENTFSRHRTNSPADMLAEYKKERLKRNSNKSK